MTVQEPRPLSQSSDETWREVRGVFADIDDTLTTAGRVTSVVFQALENLRAAGLLVIPITGRPAGYGNDQQPCRAKIFQRLEDNRRNPPCCRQGIVDVGKNSANFPPGFIATL